MVELDQIWEGFYFRYRGEVIRIQDFHFPFLTSMKREITPIRIGPKEMYMLGFRPSRPEYGEYERESTTGRKMWVRMKAKDTGWVYGIGDQEINSIHYVHELQQIWFAIFREVIRRTGDEPEPPVKLKYHIMKPTTVSLVISEPKRLHGFDKGGEMYSEIINYQEQPYYLSWDCRWLLRNFLIAIWRVEAGAGGKVKNPFFEFAGYTWGLTLAAGKDTTEADTKAAARWLRAHLEEHELR